MSLKIFFCYAHEDEVLLNKLKVQLSPLQRQGLIDTFWYDRDISAGEEWEKAIKEQINTAQIILMLVSPDFIDSDYCYGIEMKRALERHKNGEACVIPVILRPVLWQGILGNIQALPIDGRPVTGSSWHTQDEAFFNVADGIRKVVEKLAIQYQITLPEIPKVALPLPPINLEEFTLINTFQGHTGPIYNIAFSPDGQLLASGSQDQTVKLWNPFTGICLCTFKEHSSLVSSVAFSPDGQMLASGSYDLTVKLWNPLAGTLLSTLKGHLGAVSSVTFNPDRQIRMLASCSYDQKVNIWNPLPGNLLSTFNGREPLYSIGFGPDGRILACGSNKSIKAWDPFTKKLTHSFNTQETVYGIAFNADGQVFASGSNKAIKIWNPDSQKLLNTFKGHTGPIYSVAFSPDRQLLASGSQDQTIKVWNSYTGKLLHTFDGHSGAVYSVAFSPDGQLLASGSRDQTIKIWGKR